MIYFAVVVDGIVISFVTEESQKGALIDSYDNIEFYEFDWDKEEPPMIPDFYVEDGQLKQV